MKKTNYKLLNKVGNSILTQFPPDTLIEVNNAWLNEFNNFWKERKKQGYQCVLHNDQCDGSAIDSHSIPKKNLRMMSNNDKVYVLKDDFKNPFKACVSPLYIKSTLTFLGFCKKHDNDLFKEIENKNTTHYSNDDIFFLSYRTLAKEYSDIRELIERYSWELDNWESDKKKRLDREWALFQADKMKNLDLKLIQRRNKLLVTYFERRVCDKYKVKTILRKCHVQEKRFKRKLESFNTLINREKAMKMYSRKFENENQIACSFVHHFSVKGREIFLYLTSLPQKEGSLLILSCSWEDYEYIKDYSEIKKLFVGDEMLMNRILNQFKEKIAITGTDIMECDDPFFLEWDIPLATIPYFKLKRQGGVE